MYHLHTIFDRVTDLPLADDFDQWEAEVMRWMQALSPTSYPQPSERYLRNLFESGIDAESAASDLIDFGGMIAI